MFRKPQIVINAPTRTEYVDRNVTITEKRAPTDESVRLLQEMEKAVDERIIARTSVGNTTFECIVHSMMRPHDDDVLFRAMFKLNGKMMVADHVVKDRISSTPQVFDGLRDEIARVIATEVLVSALHDLQVGIMNGARKR